MEPAHNHDHHSVSVEVEGLEEIFGQSGGQPVAMAATNGGQLVATITEASRLLQIPYSTLRHQVKEGKFKTQPGPNGKIRIVLDSELATSGGQTVANLSTLATNGGQTVAKVDNKFLDFLERQSKQLQDASCRIGWLESQLQEREQEVKLLPDLQAAVSRALEQEEKLTRAESELERLKASLWYRMWCWFKSAGV